MKKSLFILFFAIYSIPQNSQNKPTIANLYIKEARSIIEDRIDFKQALVSYKKALTYMSKVTSPHVAQLGALIYYENNDYTKAKEFIDIYFSLKRKDNSEGYQNLLAFRNLINKQINTRDANNRYLQKIEALKIVWKKKSDELVLKVDKIYPFNRNNIALFLKDSYYGILDDSGNILLESSEYNTAKNFDGYLLLMDKEINPTKIYCYNTITKKGVLLPNVSTFNSKSTNYGKVMLPRGNGRLVLYPNNSYSPMIYDLKLKKIINDSRNEAIFLGLKKKKIIKKYDKEGKIKKDKIWFDYGASFGGGIHALYTKNSFNVDSYLFAENGKMVKTSPVYQYFGVFYNKVSQAILKNKIVWVNNKGKKVKDPINEYSLYLGASNVSKLESGYQIIKNNEIVLGQKKLQLLPEFLVSFGNK